MKLPTSSRIDPAKLALANAAMLSGLTSIRGISIASGLSRKTVRGLLSRLGRTVPEPRKPRTLRQVLSDNNDADVRARMATMETPEQFQRRINIINGVTT